MDCFFAFFEKRENFVLAFHGEMKAYWLKTLSASSLWGKLVEFLVTVIFLVRLGVTLGFSFEKKNENLP
ncbi:hypothetical protein [Streptococcus uberis]|uniref:hypothetical protein n=1 Tax=Streptococcus uberis TaxID=1349 RepID=UPI000620352F|nr:hypothetical protein [Streptococcus uberis]KKF45314.1 hypothetical protein AF61_03215 [Streptococcus uberis EF20/0145]KKF61036.1 hypothetical protein AF69_08885 [Streptococcus uberis 6736]MTB61645.1 hypothetical protein [Streptococcus uberis]MTB91623.1 hypothetical protein [Streptococcus uberis]